MKWNSDRLIERYYDGEAERIFKEAGIVNPHAVRQTFPSDLPCNQQIN